MTPSQVIQLQALKIKATFEGFNPALTDAILNNPDNQEFIKKDFRNVCSLIPAVLFEELESVCSILELNKREIVNLALIEFLQKSRQIIDEIDPFEHKDLILNDQKDS